jgi:hydroxymethylbilane synthase
VTDLRGNLDTRLGKVADAQYDAVILALAGILRLGFKDRVSQLLDAPEWLPAVGQGALGVTTRVSDRHTRAIVRLLEHAPTRAAVTAERALLAALEGGCQIPIGALGTATETGDQFTLHAVVASVDGTHVVRGVRGGSAQQARQIGESLADELVERGARAILDELRGAAAPNPAAP